MELVRTITIIALLGTVSILPESKSNNILQNYPPFHWVPMFGPNISTPNTVRPIQSPEPSSRAVSASTSQQGARNNGQRIQRSELSFMNYYNYGDSGQENPFLNKRVNINSYLFQERKEPGRNVSPVLQPKKINISELQRGGYDGFRMIRPATRKVQSSSSSNSNSSSGWIFPDVRKKASKTYFVFHVKETNQDKNQNGNDKKGDEQTGILHQSEDHTRKIGNYQRGPNIEKATSVVRLRGIPLHSNRFMVPISYKQQNHSNDYAKEPSVQNLQKNSPSQLVSAHSKLPTGNISQKCPGSHHFWNCFNESLKIKPYQPNLADQGAAEANKHKIKVNSLANNSSLTSNRQVAPIQISSNVPKLAVDIPNLGSISTLGLTASIEQLKKEISYDKCSHPFHSWLCRADGRALGKSLISNSTLAKVSGTGNSSFQNQSPSTTVSNPTTTSKPYSKCSHAFHSWLCHSQVPAPPVIPRGKPVVSNSKFVTSQKIQQTTTPKVTTRRGNFNFITNFRPTTKVQSTNLSTTTSRSNRGKSIFSDPKATTARPTSGKPYDKCSHAFHSWLCQKPVKTRLSSIANHVKLPIQAPFSSQVLASTTELPLSTTTLFTTRKTGSSKSYITTTSVPSTRVTERLDICSSPRHRWMCVASTTFRPTYTTDSISEPARIKSGGHLPPVTQRAIATTSKKKQNSNSWNGADPCTHAFHSWLCKPSHRRLTQGFGFKQSPVNRQKFDTSLILQREKLPAMHSATTPVTTTERTTPSTILTKPINIGSHPMPSTTEKSYSSEKPFTESLGVVRKQESDPCTHAFHRYLCKTKPTRTHSLPNPIETSSKQPPLAKSLQIQQTTMTESNKKKQESILTSLVDPPSQPTTTIRPKYDKCNHPFHSWLCEAAGRSRARQNSRSKTVIDPIIDGDRYLLKTSNLPNIRNLPLDSGEASLSAYFAPVTSTIRPFGFTRVNRNLKYYSSTQSVRKNRSSGNLQELSFQREPIYNKSMEQANNSDIRYAQSTLDIARITEPVHSFRSPTSLLPEMLSDHSSFGQKLTPQRYDSRNIQLHNSKNQSKNKNFEVSQRFQRDVVHLPTINKTYLKERNGKNKIKFHMPFHTFLNMKSTETDVNNKNYDVSQETHENREEAFQGREEKYNLNLTGDKNHSHQALNRKLQNDQPFDPPNRVQGRRSQFSKMRIYRPKLSFVLSAEMRPPPTIEPRRYLPGYHTFFPKHTVRNINRISAESLDNIHQINMDHFLHLGINSPFASKMVNKKLKTSPETLGRYWFRRKYNSDD